MEVKACILYHLKQRLMKYQDEVSNTVFSIQTYLDQEAQKLSYEGIKKERKNVKSAIKCYIYIYTNNVIQI